MAGLVFSLSLTGVGDVLNTVFAPCANFLCAWTLVLGWKQNITNLTLLKRYCLNMQHKSAIINIYFLNIFYL